MNYCFRPLIRGFFFYEEIHRNKSSSKRFPSPHSGILFLLKTCLKMKQSVLRKCFRPLIRGFFFYVKLEAIGQVELVPFPSPHSGILFFISGTSAAR